jgi:uncharacterized protein
MTAVTSLVHQLDDAQFEELLDGFATAFATTSSRRAPLFHTPAEHDLRYEDVTFPSLDGVPLEGWYVPSDNSDRLLILNHPMGFSRSGQPTHLAPWRDEWGSSGNGVEVDFTKDLKILHDAGYNVLTYDLRNHGLSGMANGGQSTSGWLEARDVVGSLRYVRSRDDIAGMRLGLYSRCLGCNATFAAMSQFADEFTGVRCLVGAQPVSTDVIVRHQLALAGVPESRLDEAISELDRRIKVTTSFGFGARDNREWARHVSVPTLLYQVHDDVLTDPSDVQGMYDSLPVKDKDLFWVPDTTVRWDGYLEFQRRPARILDWLDNHMHDA